MFLGDGRNGKSKTLELLKRFVGEENCVEVPLDELEKDLFAIGELFKKLTNLAADLSKSALKNTGRFKKLTGRDLVTAARKFLPRIKFVNYAKMLFACNELPFTYDLSTADWKLETITLTTAGAAWGTATWQSLWPGAGANYHRLDLLSQGMSIRFKFQNDELGESFTIYGWSVGYDMGDIVYNPT